MPKPTFHNLPPEKRERIIELAIDEFAEHPYRQASLSRLVTRAGIAKGSIYQYFENKFDLYRWLVLDVLTTRRNAFLESHAGPPGTSFFDRIEYMIVASTGFLLENPRLGRLGARMLEPTSDPELRELNNQMRAAGAKLTTDLVVAAQAAGEVREDFDPHVVAHLLTGMLGWGVTDAMLAKIGVDLHQLLSEPELALKLSAEEHQKLAHEGVRFVRFGLSTGDEAVQSTKVGSIPEVFSRASTQPHLKTQVTPQIPTPTAVEVTVPREVSLAPIEIPAATDPGLTP